jgi:hypothetical protein
VSRVGIYDQFKMASYNASKLSLQLDDLGYKNRLLAAELNLTKMNYTLMADQAVLVESECKNTTDGMLALLDECVEGMRVQSLACNQYVTLKATKRVNQLCRYARRRMEFIMLIRAVNLCSEVAFKVTKYRSNASLENQLANVTATLVSAQFQLQLQAVHVSNLEKRLKCLKAQRDQYMLFVERLNATLEEHLSKEEEDENEATGQLLDELADAAEQRQAQLLLNKKTNASASSLLEEEVIIIE